MNVFTDNPDLYPTPAEVIDRMLEDIPVSGKVILEPSAGTGNIVSRLAELGAKEVLACETDPNLRAILATKPCEVVAGDFLTLKAEDVSHVDAIVMNPPYSHDMEHILHAYEIAPEGATVTALCNASHIWNHGYRTTLQIKFMETIQDHGWSEDIGQVFKTAERGTDVFVGLVRLYKPRTGADEFADYLFDQAPDTEAYRNDTPGLMSYDFLRDIVNRYVAAVSLFDEVKQKAEEINGLAKFPGTDVYSQPPIEFKTVYVGTDKRVETVTRDRYKKELQKYYWRVIFKKMDMEQYATQKLREQINRFVERQQNVPFTMRNIWRVLDIIMQTNGQRMQTALVDAFDTICDFSSENSTAGEKWKTNSDYMVNRRFIVPWIARGYRWDKTPNPYVEIDYCGHTNKVEDVTKALCWFTKRRYETIPNLRSMCDNYNIEWGSWFIWGFFRCRAYKKGTMHFEFLDEDVWARFNQEVARIRGWRLPGMTNQTKDEKRKAARKRPADTADLFAGVASVRS